MEVEDFLYEPAEGLWVVTAYYNPCGYKSRLRNYQIFAESLRRSGIPLLTVECAFGSESFSLPKSDLVVQVGSNSLIWQKERLLNLGISWLPKSCKYVAWLDCDLVFENRNWAVDTVRLLDKVPVVQVFETCNRLPEGGLKDKERGEICRSFASITPMNPRILEIGHFEKHGHTGYGWAARRNLLDKHGLYEYAIIGSADHYMAHAIYGDFGGACMELATNKDNCQLNHFRDWAEPFYADVRGELAAVPGNVFHLWHGNLINRGYLKRNHELTSRGFDPYTDLLANPGKPLEWRPGLKKTDLIEMFAGYFASREEDSSVLKVQ
jgi:hypothetical protein